jgi:hypothetical protein
MGDLDSDRRCEVVLIMTRTEARRGSSASKTQLVPYSARKGSTLTAL